jgi:hypothetical protein|nr:PEP/pyruvate-binding domain-containing protein [Kofleriaceae bacterium]
MKQAWLALCLVVAMAATARADVQRSWVSSIPDDATWKAYSKTVGADQLGKCIIDIKSNNIYFFDVNLFNIHADFVLGVLLHQAWNHDNVVEFNKNYERDKPKFILCYLTHHLKVDKWTFSFWEGDKIDADGIARTKKRLDDSFFRAKDLLFRPDSPLQQKIAVEVAKKGIKTITNNEIYKSSEFQAFTKGRAVGTLRVVPIGTPYESLNYNRHDIVLLQESYPDITPVAGIIATQFSTPLSHVNLRAGAWHIPNAGDKKARDKWGKLDGKLVYYEVTDTAVTLREPTQAEITELDRPIGPKHVDLPKADLSNSRFAMLTRMRAKDVIVYGTKASNLGEIVTANIPGVRVPMGFGVGFYYYDQHMKQNHLYDKVDAMLGDARWKDPAWRRDALVAVQKQIMDAPIDEATLDAIYKRVRLELGGKGVFVRSSSNSEDLPGFNGAGLYDTRGNVVGKQQLADALRYVWASIWNLRAVDEREAFGIDHKQVYMGVLVQIGINATAAGVLVTKNLFDPSDDHGFTINAKWGLGERVVQGQKSPEQIIFDPTNDGTKIIARSDDPVMLKFDDHGGLVEQPVPPGQEVILTEARAKKLGDMVMKFIPVFAKGVPLDVEWVLEGEDIWIVQARPYVGG